MEKGGSHTPRPVVALPCGSRSMTSVSMPLAQALAASPRAIVVFTDPALLMAARDDRHRATVAG